MGHPPGEGPKEFDVGEFLKRCEFHRGMTERNSYIAELLLQHVPNNEYIQLERVVGHGVGEFRRISIPTQISSDKSWAIFAWHVHRYSEIREIVFYPNGRSREVSGDPGIVAFVRNLDRMEAFGIHRARIHQKIVQDAVTFKM
jgi:hypothetical protein